MCAAVSCRKRRRTVAESSVVCGGSVCVYMCVCVSVCANDRSVLRENFLSFFLLALHSISLRNTQHIYWGVFLSPVYLFCSIVCFVCIECDMAGPVVIYSTAASTANISLTSNQAIKS